MILWILLGVAVFLVALQFLSTTEYTTIPNKENSVQIPPEDRILFLAPIYMAFADSHPDFDKFSQEEIQPVCPLYVPDTETYRNCIDKILEFKMLTEGVSQEKADQAEKACASMILNFGTNSKTEPNMLIDTYNACLWYKLDS